MAVYEEYLNYRLTGRCSNPFWQRKFNGMSGGGGDTPGGGGDTPGGGDVELMSWEGVAYHIDKGDYKDVYSVGDMVPLDLGTEGTINMQIAAFDADTLADGSGTAAISWVGKELLNTSKRMNPALSGTSGAYTESTGSIGGWEKCEMRASINGAIGSLIPNIVAGMIVPVTKTQSAFDTAGNAVTQTTTDSEWIPSRGEVFDGRGIYTGLFGGNVARRKCKVGTTSNVEWFLRDGYGSNIRAFTVISTGGMTDQGGADSDKGVCLGFCTGRTPT